MIELTFLIVLFTQGLFYSGSEGYIFEGLRRFIATKVFRLQEGYNNDAYSYFDNVNMNKDTIRDYLFKPVWGCIHCMNSFWGVLICLTYGASLIESIVSICGAVGVSFIIEKIID